MANDSPFADDWRDCLREHYRTVVRNEDRVTLRTLPTILNDLGFSEAELRQLYIEATMHVDTVSPDFLPDAEIIEAERTAAITLETAEMAALAASQLALDAAALDELFEDDDTPPDPGIKQMSLF